MPVVPVAMSATLRTMPASAVEDSVKLRPDPASHIPFHTYVRLGMPPNPDRASLQVTGASSVLRCTWKLVLRGGSACFYGLHAGKGGRGGWTHCWVDECHITPHANSLTAHVAGSLRGTAAAEAMAARARPTKERATMMKSSGEREKTGVE